MGMRPIAIRRAHTDGEKGLNRISVRAGAWLIFSAMPVKALRLRTRSAPMSAVL